MSEAVTRTDHAGIRVLAIDYPPVNGLGAAVRQGLADEMTHAAADDSVDAIVITGSGKLFCAGADIRELGQTPPEGTPTLPKVIDGIERSDKLVVAAIHGVAAGGGFELALGCHARLAANDARVGLPEVTLGIIPGAGGTQRLPRLVGIATALELILSGALVPAAAAHADGSIDAVVDSDVVGAAVAYARQFIAEGKPIDRVSARTVSRDDRALVEVPARFAKKYRGFLALPKAVDAVRASAELPFAEGVGVERALFVELVDSQQAKALRHAFFAEREAAKIPDIDKSVSTKEIEHVGIVGCGTMGSGIAMSFVNRGIAATIVEDTPEALERGLERIRDSYRSSVDKGRIPEAEMKRRLSRVRGTVDLSELASEELVIEAVFESMEVKKDVFRRLDETCEPKTILATNTSTLDINEIATATGRPQKVVGTHFFSPAHIMTLMENVRGKETSKETVATIMRLSKRLGKTAVLVGVCDGFVGNRMLYAYRRQAEFLLEEGALPEQVDAALYDFGMPMGPFAMADLAGLDIGWAVRKNQAATRDSQLRYSPIADRICEQGRFGQKTGTGWYRYEPGNRDPIADPKIRELIESVSKELGIARRTIEAEEIVQRCIYALINEGAKILDEGIALRASDIDVVWMHGYGFPRYRGGPMCYGESVGLDHIVAALSSWEEDQGAWATPATLLERLAREGKPFKDAARPR